MDRAAAMRLIAKLDALADPARNTEAGERDAARAKASALRARFKIERVEAPPSRPRRVFTAAPQGAPVGEPWDFDIRTGKASGNVKVHSYTDRSNWRIEIPL